MSETTERTAEEALTQGVELVLTELVVSLIASGALTQEEAVRATLRAEVAAGSMDLEHGSSAPRAADAVRLLQGWLFDRIGGHPTAAVLRRDRAAWDAAQGVRAGAHPFDPS